MTQKKGEAAASPLAYKPEYFQFEMLCISNHTACRFAEKTRFFRSLRTGRRCAAASRFTFFKVETLSNARDYGRSSASYSPSGTR